MNDKNSDGDIDESEPGTVETQELVNNCVAVEEMVRNNIENAQKKQCAEYAKKLGKGVKTFTFRARDLVLRLNARKRGRKGDTLSAEWLGPYTVVGITANGQCTLEDKHGKELRTKINSSQLKPYHTAQKMANSSKASGNTTEVDGLLAPNNVVSEESQLPGDALVSGNESISLPLDTGKIPLCTVTSAYISPVEPTSASPLSTFEPVPASDFTHKSTSMISDAVLSSSDPTDTDVQFLGIVASPMHTYNERRTERSIRLLTKKRTLPTSAIPYVGKVGFDTIMNGELLTDLEVNAAQVLLQRQFPHVQGMQDTLLGSTLMFNIIAKEMLQILHDGHLHWLLISTLGCTDGQVKIYDSLMSPPSLQVQLQIASLLCSHLPKMQCAYQSCQQQNGGADCGLFAIAFAVDICLGLDVCALAYEQSQMRTHLCKCIRESRFTSFPRKDPNQRIKKCKAVAVSVPLYCVCRLPDNTQEQMVQCTACKDWFHVSCQRVPKAVIGTTKLWNCSCCSKRSL